MGRIYGLLIWADLANYDMIVVSPLRQPRPGTTITCQSWAEDRFPMIESTVLRNTLRCIILLECRFCSVVVFVAEYLLSMLHHFLSQVSEIETPAATVWRCLFASTVCFRFCLFLQIIIASVVQSILAIYVSLYSM